MKEKSISYFSHSKLLTIGTTDLLDNNNNSKSKQISSIPTVAILDLIKGFTEFKITVRKLYKLIIEETNPNDDIIKIAQDLSDIYDLMKGPFSHIYKLGLENKGEDLIFIYNVEPTTSKTIREYVKRML